MRNRGQPVIWVRQEFEPDLRDAYREMKAKGIRITIKERRAARSFQNWLSLPRTLLSSRSGIAPFYGTDLDETLETLRAESIMLAGINTHACIRTTAVDACQRDWMVVLALDCIDSYDLGHHQVSLKYLKNKIAAVRTNQETLKVSRSGWRDVLVGRIREGIWLASAEERHVSVSGSWGRPVCPRFPPLRTPALFLNLTTVRYGKTWKAMLLWSHQLPMNA